MHDAHDRLARRCAHVERDTELLSSRRSQAGEQVSQIAVEARLVNVELDYSRAERRKVRLKLGGVAPIVIGVSRVRKNERGRYGAASAGECRSDRYRAVLEAERADQHV